MSGLDNILAHVAPQWALKRARAQLKYAQVTRAKAYFDGADIGRRGASIRRATADANTVTARTLPALRAGANDLVRNNPYARAGVEVVVTQTVGGGIRPAFYGAADKDGKQSKHDELNALSRRHLMTAAIDADGRHNYLGLQAIIMRTMVTAGEALIVKVPLKSGTPHAVPLQVRVLEPDFIDESKDGTLKSGGGFIIQGVEFNSQGQRVAYWLFDNHPGGSSKATSSRVPAALVGHVFRQDRPGQTRGIPWLAVVMLRLADLNDLEDAYVMRQKIAACFGMIIRSDEDADPDENDSGEEEIQPGMKMRLKSGEDVTFANPPGVDGIKDFTADQKRAFASALGISYESLTGDLSRVNFSSGRMGWLQMHRNTTSWTQGTLIPQVCDLICGWFMEAAALKGVKVEGATVRHTPPRRELMDPTREVPAMIKAVRSGQISHHQMALMMGLDAEDHFNEVADGFALLDKLNLVLDTDPRKVSAAGLTQARTAGTTTDGIWDEAAKEEDDENAKEND